MSEQAQRQLRHFLTALIAVAVFFEAIFVAFAILLHSVALGSTVVIFTGFLVTCVISWHSMRQEKLGRSASIVGVSMVVAALSLAPILPFGYPPLAMVPLIAIAAMLPYLGGHSLRLMMIAAILGTVSITGMGLFFPNPIELPRSLIHFLLVTGAAACSFLILVLFFQFGEGLRGSQEDLQRERDKLEIRVEERTAELAALNVDLRQVNEQLNRRTVQLAQKNEEVEAFVYIVSHDLRSPLVNLQGFSKELESCCKELEERLRGATLPANVEKAVNSILADGIYRALRFISVSMTKLQRLIDALLRLSRLGRQEYRLERVDVGAVVSSTLDSLRQSIQESGAKISVQPLPETFADLTAVGQVFSNLIGNALKYLQLGRPGLIEIGGEPRDAMVHYWVRDNGSGIHAGAQRRLFQAFQRFHPQLALGDGLGLAIIKRVVERHGGTVWAESTEGVGTTFHLTLPAVNAAQG